MEVRYVAEFKIEELTGKKADDTKKEASEILSKERKFDSKLVGKGLSATLGATMIGLQIYSKLESTANSIKGDAIAQRRFDNKMAIINEGLGIGGALGLGLLTPVGLPAAVLGISTKYIMQSFNLQQSNQIKQASWQVDRRVNAERQNRLVKDSTGVRV